jgi:uncharacterized membrane protein
MMRRHLLSLLMMLALLTVSSAALPQQQTTYRLMHLGTNDTFLNGFNFADLNNKGEIVGNHIVEGRFAGAFIWRDGEFHDLVPLPRNDISVVAINDHTEVVGTYTNEQSQPRGFVWRRGKITLLQTPSGQFIDSPADINNRREVLVSIRDPHDVLGFFLWRNGQLTRLEPPPCCPGFEDGTSPVRLNNRGAAVGTDGGFNPVLWEDGTIMQIQMPPGAASGGASDINDHGVIVGHADFDGRVGGYRWQDGEAVKLRHLTGSEFAVVFDMNNRDAIVGLSFVAGDDRGAATLWPRQGNPVDLNTLIADDDPLKPFVHLIGGNLINDRGVILAVGNDVRNHPFSRGNYLLTPQH